MTMSSSSPQIANLEGRSKNVRCTTSHLPRPSSPSPDITLTTKDRNGTTQPEPTQSQSTTTSRPITQVNFATPPNKVNGTVSTRTPLFLASQSQLGSSQPLARAPMMMGSSPIRTRLATQSQDIAPVQKPLRPAFSWVQKARFPRLSDIAPQQMLSPLSAHPIPVHPTSAAGKKGKAVLSLDHDDDDSDSSGSGSDSDPQQGGFRIPKGQRAGAQKRH